MKRSLSVLLILCLFAALLSGCAGSLPPLPPLPGRETEAPEESAAPEDAAAAEPTPAPVFGPEPLELGFALPEAGEETLCYFSPAEEFDCAFSYPASCALWAENGSLRLSTPRFFARMFFTGVRKDAPGAPEELIGMLEPGKWDNSAPTEITVGSGFSALRMSHLKYDTWRRWIVWETPERFYQLYGVCFDGLEEAVGEIFQQIASSFRTGAELLAKAPAEGTVLYDDGALRLRFAGAQLRSAQSAPSAEIALSVEKLGGPAVVLSVDALTADGETLPFEALFTAEENENGVFLLSVPIAAEGGAFFEGVGFRLSARADGTRALFELPVRIELNG